MARNNIDAVVEARRLQRNEGNRFAQTDRNRGQHGVAIDQCQNIVDDRLNIVRVQECG
jgi:hypothetical protein